jgi:protein PhnA
MLPNPALLARSESQCELCQSPTNLLVHTIAPFTDDKEKEVVLCTVCDTSIIANDFSNKEHFRNLAGSIWSEVAAVKVLSYKLLQKLNTQDWAQDALDGAFLTEQEMAWAMAEDEAKASVLVHKDAYGVTLVTGDTVLLTENLNVKGTNFIAPKGTKVSRIRVVPDNDQQIEGRIDGSMIVILTKFVRKSN